MEYSSILILEYVYEYIFFENSDSKACAVKHKYFYITGNNFHMMTWFNFVSGALVGSLCTEQIFSWITDKINLLIAKTAFNNGVLEKILILK